MSDQKWRYIAASELQESDETHRGIVAHVTVGDMLTSVTYTDGVQISVSNYAPIEIVDTERKQV